jgi:hypothetical protein
MKLAYHYPMVEDYTSWVQRGYFFARDVPTCLLSLTIQVEMKHVTQVRCHIAIGDSSFGEDWIILINFFKFTMCLQSFSNNIIQISNVRAFYIPPFWNSC